MTHFRWAIRLAVVLLLVPAICQPVLGVSTQIEMTQPILTLADERVHGRASFGFTAGSDVYDTAGILGATFPLGNIDRGRIYFNGNIFTWIENPDLADFEPRRVIYTLEPGYYWERGDGGYRFFIKHQSYHDVDFYDDLDESYELIGFSYRRLQYPSYTLSIGKYSNGQDVGYDWDLAASATYLLRPMGDRDVYFHVWLHHVTESDGPAGRSGFTDYATEMGLRFPTDVILFARYEFLHDIDRFGGLSDHHILTGIRYIW